ncbi:MAG TPA: cytochrome c [Verrucomicrobiae bacterium]|nr:cytochrome c [Verrucomicrobiae bacterium]
MNQTTKNLGAVAVIGVLLAGICLFSSPAKADVAAAEATFKSKCAMCHGADGKGKSSMTGTDLTSADVQKMSDADVSAVITNGKPPKMPAYKSMTPDQVKDMVAYIRSLKK